MTTLNRHQLNILSGFCGDEPHHEVHLAHFEDGHSGPGLYTYDPEYPEEGSIFLDPEPDPEESDDPLQGWPDMGDCEDHVRDGGTR